MLIKVNSLIYKTKINVKGWTKINITKKTNKKAGSSNGLPPTFAHT